MSFLNIYIYQYIRGIVRLLGNNTVFSRFSFPGLPFLLICPSDGTISLSFKVLPLFMCPDPSDVVVCLSVLFMQLDFLKECRSGDVCLKKFLYSSSRRFVSEPGSQGLFD